MKRMFFDELYRRAYVEEFGVVFGAFVINDRGT